MNQIMKDYCTVLVWHHGVWSQTCSSNQQHNKRELINFVMFIIFTFEIFFSANAMAKCPHSNRHHWHFVSIEGISNGISDYFCIL